MRIAPALAALLTLAACGVTPTAAPSTSPYPAPTAAAAPPSPSPIALPTSYTTTAGILAALNAAGLPCTAAHTDSPAPLQIADEQVRCVADDEEIVIGLFRTQTRMLDQVATFRATGKLIGYHLAYGPAWWTINAWSKPGYADDVARALGGTAVHSTG